MSSTDKRTTYVKLENKWKYIHQAMVKKWTIPSKSQNLASLTLNINGVEVRPSKVTDSSFVFDWKALRSKWFDLLGMTSNECDLMALEDACEYAQLEGMNHYTLTPVEEIRGCLFTPSLTIVFNPVFKPGKEMTIRLEVTEEYLISDVHKKQE